MENPIKMDDLGVPLFLETRICPRSDITEFWKKFPTSFCERLFACESFQLIIVFAMESYTLQ